jgi:hypothetical protein
LAVVVSGRSAVARRAAVIAFLFVAACGPTPSLASPTVAALASPPATASVTRSCCRTPEPTPTPIPTVTFSFDVENHSKIAVIVSVVSDRAAILPGFEPGQRGTISLPLVNPQNGIYIEFQVGGCKVIATASYPTPDPFTLVIDDGAKVGTITLSTRPGTTPTPMPLPSDSLEGCGG